jgi:hypothetical protein
VSAGHALVHAEDIELASKSNQQDRVAEAFEEPMIAV